jgi:hypothetical protein
MRKILKVYALVNLAVVAVSLTMLITAPLPQFETWSSLFGIVAVALTTTISTIWA